MNITNANYKIFNGNYNSSYSTDYNYNFSQDFCNLNEDIDKTITESDFSMQEF